MSSPLRNTKGYQPTMHLRFIKRLSKAHPEAEVYKFILQQKWESADGKRKWIDVPRYDPVQEEAHDHT